MKKTTKQTIDYYVHNGIRPGGFLQAVLANDLFDAVAKADRENLRDLREICSYIYNECPAPCWGDRESISDWIAYVRGRNNAQKDVDRSTEL